MAVAIRTLLLNCLTTHYAPLWSEVFTLDFTQQRWSQPDNPRLPQDFFARLTPAWSTTGVRGAILAVPGRQRDAAYALGLSRAQTMRFVVVPHALRAMVPLLATNCVPYTCWQTAFQLP